MPTFSATGGAIIPTTTGVYDPKSGGMNYPTPSGATVDAVTGKPVSATPTVQPTVISSAARDEKNAANLAQLQQVSQQGKAGYDVFGQPVSTEGLSQARAQGGTYQGVDGKTYYNYDSTAVAGQPGVTAMIEGTNIPATGDSATDAQLKRMNDMQTQMDATSAAQMQGIQNAYQQLIAEQQKINAGTQASTYSLLQRGGALRAGSSAGIIQSQVDAGMAAINKLQTAEQSALVAAQQAAQANDYKILDSQLSIYNQVRQEKQAAAQKLNDTLLAQQQKQAEDMKQLQQENQKNIDDVLKTAADNGAPASVIASIQNAKDLGGAITAAGKYGAGGPGLVGEFNFAKAQGYVGTVVDYLKAKTEATTKPKVTAAGVATTAGISTSGVTDALVQAVQNGSIDPNRVNSRTLSIYNAIAQAGVDAVGSHASAAGEAKAVTDLTNYKAIATRTVGTVDLNMPLVAALADKVNTKGIPYLDQMITGLRQYTGNDPDVIKYINSLQTIRSEYAQMLAKGAGVTDADKAHAIEAIPAGKSSAAYYALADQLKLEAKNIIRSSDNAIAAAKDKTGGVTSSIVSDQQNTIQRIATWVNASASNKTHYENLRKIAPDATPEELMQQLNIQ